MKQIRIFLQDRYNLEFGGISFRIIEQLSFCEDVLRIHRDPSTDSIWNIQHQEQRIEVFEKSDAHGCCLSTKMHLPGWCTS